MDEEKLKCAAEMALLCTPTPLDVKSLRYLLGTENDSISADDVKRIIHKLSEEWGGRALELKETASGWQFRTREDYRSYVKNLMKERPPRLSRPLLEVLSVIAYLQPATRGDIEKVRGVSVSAHHIRLLEECDWIESVGRREVPGYPALYETTKTFLDDLGLKSLDELPPLEDIDPSEIAELQEIKNDGEKERTERNDSPPSNKEFSDVD